MPLLRYFGFAGGALVLLLFGLSWCVPQPVAEPIRSGMDRPVIRISSVDQLPERVDIDSSLPTIVPSPNVMEFAERWPVPNSVETLPKPKPTAPTAGDDVPKKPSVVKREPVKKSLPIEQRHLRITSPHLRTGSRLKLQSPDCLYWTF